LANLHGQDLFEVVTAVGLLLRLELDGLNRPAFEIFGGRRGRCG
jgi:hypothetical protein